MFIVEAPNLKGCLSKVLRKNFQGGPGYEKVPPRIRRASLKRVYSDRTDDRDCDHRCTGIFSFTLLTGLYGPDKGQ